MSQFSRRDLSLMALTVAVVLIPCIVLGMMLSDKFTYANEQLAKLEPRYARLLGLRANASKMDEQVKASEERMAQFVYPANLDATQAGNDAQQSVRSILTTAGLTVVSSQVLPTKDEQGFERISLSVRTEGELLHLQAALAVLPSLTPVVLVDTINIQVIGLQRADQPQRLGTELKLTVLHRKPA